MLDDVVDAESERANLLNQGSVFTNSGGVHQLVDMDFQRVDEHNQFVDFGLRVHKVCKIYRNSE